MPTNVVKSPREEKLWEQAKSQAAREGKHTDWAYVMGIYQKMLGNKK
jgi:hypothetical protein